MVALWRKFIGFSKKVPALNSFSSSATKWNSPIQATISHPLLVALESCSSMELLKQIQARMTRTGLVSHVFPASRVLAFCALSDSGDMAYARSFFHHFQTPNTYMWNTIVRGYVKAGMPGSGLASFRKMIELPVSMDSGTFVFALKACEKIQGISEGGSVHCVVWKMGFEFDLLIGNGLVHFYAEIGCLNLARKVFDNIPNKDVVSWTTMIDGYVTSELSDEALELYHHLLMSESQPNDVTLIAVFSACCKKKNFVLGKTMHNYVLKTGRKCGMNLLNAILDMYMKFGCLNSAQNMFDHMIIKDVFTWTIMVNGLSKNGKLLQARMFFDRMPERNHIAWNAMIAGYSQSGKIKETLELFVHMIDSGLVPTESTLACVLSSCGESGCHSFGQWIHSKYVQTQCFAGSIIVGNALIEMYAKMGFIKEASEVFINMPNKDLASWNSMITAYAVHGHAREALNVFETMCCEGVNPDDITMVGVLSACSHGGMVNEGINYFQRMKADYRVEPKEEHFSCIIDLLGRVGLVEEAYGNLLQMEMKPGKGCWGALLNACKIYGNCEVAEIAAENLMKLDPGDAGNYVLLASTYANDKKWDEARNVRKMMRKKGVKKLPGQSIIEVDGEFHCFFSSDIANPQSQLIYRFLEDVYAAAKQDYNRLIICDPL